MPGLNIGLVMKIVSTVCVPEFSLTSGTTYNGTNSSSAEGGIVKDGNYVYVGSSSERLTIFDVSNPASPSVVSSITDTYFGGVTWMVKEGNYLYLISSTQYRLVVVDVSTPSSPSIVGSVYDGTYMAQLFGLVKVGNYCYTSGQYFCTIDVTTPSSPSFVGALPGGTIQYCDQMVYDAGYCYVTRWLNNGLSVVDVSTPGSPSHVTFFSSTPATTRSSKITKDGDLVYIALNIDKGLSVIDVSTPSSPSLLGTLDQVTGRDTTFNGLVKSGDYLYAVAQGDNGVVAWDVSDPADITEVDFITDATNNWLDAPHLIVKDGTNLFVGAYYFTVVGGAC